MPLRIIGIGGGSASGKTKAAEQLEKQLREEGKKVSIVGCDQYYRSCPDDQDPEERNYDHPSAVELSLLARHLIELKNGKTVKAPTYSYVKHKRCEKTVEIRADLDYIIIEGIFALLEILFDIYDYTIFVDATDKNRLKRRISRDCSERGRSRPEVVKQYNQTVRPAYEEFILPTKKRAKKVLSNNGTMYEFIELIKTLKV